MTYRLKAEVEKLKQAIRPQTKPDLSELMQSLKTMEELSKRLSRQEIDEAIKDVVEAYRKGGLCLTT